MLDPALFARPWEIPELTSMNRLRGRADLVPYPTAAAALSRNPKKSKWFLPLDGKWSVSYHDKVEQVKAAEVADKADTAKWPKVDVPGDLCTQGFSHPHYTNVQMPFRNDPPRVPDDNPCAVLRTSFVLPKGWAKRRTVLHVGAAESQAWYYLNGALVGMSTDSKLPSEFDLTKHLREGRNELAVLCVRWSAQSYVEDQDHWMELGIHRSVYLYSQDRIFLGDVTVRAGWDWEAKKPAGTLWVRAKAEYVSSPDRHGWNNLDDEDLKALTGLRLVNLYLYCNVDLRDISPIAEIQSLELLHIGGNRELQGIEKLSALSGLLTLDISYCPVKDFLWVGDFKKLETLRIEYSDYLDFYTYYDLSACKTLKTIVISKQDNDVEKALKGMIADIRPDIGIRYWEDLAAGN